MRKRKATAIFGIRLLPACFFAAICILLITTCYLEGDINALKPTGSGTKDDPYRVWNVETLEKVGTGEDGWDMDKCYRQTRNINMLGVTWDPIGYYISTEDNDLFEGNYDGQGFLISNLVIKSSADNQGLFGVIGKNGKVEYINLADVDISGDDNTHINTGGVVGLNYGTVSNCCSTGSVIGYDSVGGIVGKNDTGDGGNGKIENCYSTCNVTGTNNSVGGVAGYVDGGNVTNCYSTGKVKGNSYYVGGVVGYIHRGRVINCHSTGKVGSSDSVGNSVGGVVGNNDKSNVATCYSTGTVTGADHVGGVVGTNENEGNVTTCFYTGTVTGVNDVGGVVGTNENGGKVTNCYSTSNVIATFTTSCGGVIGYNLNGGIVTNCYSTGPVEGPSGSIGGVMGQTDALGKVENCVALGPRVTNAGIINIGRVVGHSAGTLLNNYARSDMLVNTFSITSNDENSTDGADVDESGPNGGYYNQNFWKNTVKWDGLEDVWEIRSGGLPILQGFPGVTQNPVIQ